MLRRLGHLLVIAALLAATETHWVLAQSVAWTTMLADNLEKTSLGDALDRTFDGKHPCAICRRIETGKKSEKKSELSNPARKLEYCRTEASICLPPPTRIFPSATLRDGFESLQRPPPTPPPRLLPG